MNVSSNRQRIGSFQDHHEPEAPVEQENSRSVCAALVREAESGTASLREQRPVSGSLIKLCPTTGQRPRGPRATQGHGSMEWLLSAITFSLLVCVREGKKEEKKRHTQVKLERALGRAHTFAYHKIGH